MNTKRKYTKIEITIILLCLTMGIVLHINAFRVLVIGVDGENGLDVLKDVLHDLDHYTDSICHSEPMMVLSIDTGSQKEDTIELWEESVETSDHFVIDFCKTWIVYKSGSGQKEEKAIIDKEEVLKYHTITVLLSNDGSEVRIENQAEGDPSFGIIGVDLKEKKIIPMEVAGRIPSQIDKNGWKIAVQEKVR